MTDGLTPNYSVKFDGKPLTSGTDYTASITKNGQAVTNITQTGTYTLTITGTGDYAGSISKNFEVYSQASVPYVDADGELQHTRAEDFTQSTNDDWWYITGEVNLGNRIEINGEKHIILCDGATLSVPKGIHLTNGNTLHIYGQSARTGKLIINNVYDNQAGIGGNQCEDCGSLIVNGGEIDVTGGKDGGSGIGGGAAGKNTTGGSGGNITINGGIVSAGGNGSHSFGMDGAKNCADKGTVSINWKNLTDKVSSKSYNCNVTLSGSFMLEGTDTTATPDNIGGKTIVPAVTVTFDKNGGGGSMSEVKTAYGNSYTLPQCTFTAPNGQEFVGWEIGGTQYSVGEKITLNSDILTADGNITVKAVWQDSKVYKTVTFNANGHGTAPEAQSIEENTADSSDSRRLHVRGVV